MSITLNAEGSILVGAHTYSEPKCAHGHARGAESLASWLWRRNQLGPPKVHSNAETAKERLEKKTGIIFFKNCFTRDGETVRTGDHIDLWNMGIVKTYDDPKNLATQVWFWELA